MLGAASTLHLLNQVILRSDLSEVDAWASRTAHPIYAGTPGAVVAAKYIGSSITRALNICPFGCNICFRMMPPYSSSILTFDLVDG